MAIPESLLRCFNDLDFLADIKDNQKVCFRKRYYVEKDGWSGIYGSIIRTLENERMNVSGIAELRSIAASTLELFNIYKDDKIYGDKFLLKIISAIKGLERLEQTYKSIGKNVESSQIRNSIILSLEALVPDQFKEKSKVNRKLNAEPLVTQNASISYSSEDEDISDS